MILYTSDIHFSDEKILNVCNRPFGSVGDMDNGIIEKWNKKVSTEDTVYILGDVFPCECNDPRGIIDLLKKLNGTKMLIIGNHDEKFLNELRESRVFSDITHIATVNDNGREIVLCHYPLMTWKNDDSSIHFYGHVHNKELPETEEMMSYYKRHKKEMAFNVGLDVRGFVPVGLNEILRGN